MVVDTSIQDIFKESLNTPNFTLPTYKRQKLTLTFHDGKVDTSTVYQWQPPILPFATSESFGARIIDSKCLVQGDNDFKAVYEVTFDVNGSNFEFKPGDTIGVIPQNQKEEVAYVINQLDLTTKADCIYSINVNKSTKVPPHIPIQSSLRHVLMNCVELRSVVKKLFLLELSQYTEDVNEKKALEYLCSKEGAAMYTQYVLNRNLCLVDILNTFKTTKPPFEVILTHLPRLLPRPYSIVNSMKKHEGRLKICFSVMKFDSNKKGLTTGWLESLIIKKGSSLEDTFNNLAIDEEALEIKIPIYLRINMDFSLPELETPLLLVGPGTGVAPFIGFLEERLYLKEKSSELIVGETWLFFGCRNPNIDFIYKDELDILKDKSILTKISTSFSRVENGGIKYVQDAIKMDAENVAKFIQDGAAIYVCGDLKAMVSAVRQAFIQCLMQCREINEQDAEDIITDMEREKKYLVDVWS